MKKIFYAIAAMFLALGLSSCNGEIKDVKIGNLVGTWDLVSRTTVTLDGKTNQTSYNQGDEYLVIEQSKITFGYGNRTTSYPFSFGDPYFIVDGNSQYELVKLTRNEMILKDNSLLGSLLTKEQTLTYQRRK